MGTARVSIARPVLEWARLQGRRDEATMRQRFHQWDQWLTEGVQPTVRQVQAIADFTHVPVGLLFMPEAPILELPIPDFRVTGKGREPSRELLDTIYLSQQRQAWFEDYLSRMGADPLPFVGSARLAGVETAASMIAAGLHFDSDTRAQLRTTDDARKYLVQAFENVGGLVVVSSMVDNNTHRLLDREEFRGFTLHSPVAPLVFVNAHDTKPGQVFSLLHEFAHVWRGESGVSHGGEPLVDAETDAERWCDQVAAEIAVPAIDLTRRFEPATPLQKELERLADFYRCSTLVVLLRLRDVGLLSPEGFDSLYSAELVRLLAFISERGVSSGGDFYNNQPFRIGERLSRALVSDTLRGATPMTEALRLMSFGSMQIFDEYASRLERA